MNIQETIKNWNKKPKELVEFLTKNVLKDKKNFSQLIDILKNGNDVDKGTCADVMKHVSAEKPEFFLPYINVLVEYINYKAPRVKWGVPESFGNIAKEYPKEAEKAAPNLLKNTIENKENTTVIRWCAAYALSEIAKSTKNKKLIEKINEIIKKEKNNGVKNVYIKALKIIEKK
jgi:hypothetical protein